MYTEYSVLKELHHHLGNDLGSRFTYNHFRLSWYNYLNLLDIDYESGFRCHICGDLPTTLIMDGTSLAFRKELDTWGRFLNASSPIESIQALESLEDKLGTYLIMLHT